MKDIHIHFTFVSRFLVINYRYAVTITTSSVNVCHNFLFVNDFKNIFQNKSMSNLSEALFRKLKYCHAGNRRQ